CARLGDGYPAWFAYW
nr:immunoglobulin heavy chain junction region [Mus musculus]